MIRQGKVHGLSVTGANLEEDFFNMIAHNSYTRIPDWRGAAHAHMRIPHHAHPALVDPGLKTSAARCAL